MIPGLGKSFLTLDLAARLTAGRAWPFETQGAGPGSVIVLSAEDSPSDTIRPRVDAMVGDACHVFVQRMGESISLDRASLRAMIDATGARLVIIDPLTAYLGTTDAYKDAEVRQLLTPLAGLAAETKVAIIAVMHLNKDEQKKGLYRTGGSVAFVALARVVHVVATDPDDPDRRIFGCHKLNLGPKPAPLRFRLTDRRVEWQGVAADVDLEALLAPMGTSRGKPARKAEEAGRLLRSQLAAGPVAASEVKDAARAKGISDATVERAKMDLGVVTRSRPGGGWLWELPKSSRPPAGG